MPDIKKQRVIFLGTPQFATVILEKLIASGTYKPILVIAQPDKPIGRKQIITPPATKILAQKHTIDIFQPKTLKSEDAVNTIKKYNPDIMLVAAYGKIIPQNIIDIPQYNILNVHTSLLPRWRGASPVAHAILAGDKETGVTIMQIEMQLDAGPMLTQEKIPITNTDTTSSLKEKLAHLGGNLLLETLSKWIAGKITPNIQDNAQTTFAKLLEKKDGEITEKHTAKQIDAMARALNPWPGVYMIYKEKKLKILKAKIIKCTQDKPPLSMHLESKELILYTKDGCLALETIQPESKNKMSGYDFYLGYCQDRNY